MAGHGKRTLTLCLQGMRLNTSIPDAQLFIDRSVPGLVHVYGNEPAEAPMNFGTVLLWQEIKGGKVRARAGTVALLD
eukprot:257926-Chlamydomonas_euryale.AAC.3